MNKVWVKDYELEDSNHPQNRGMVTFETRVRSHPDGSIEKKIWINNEPLDWSIDISDYKKAVALGYKKQAQESIARHFIDSISQIVGRKLTIKDIQTAQKTGWI